MASHGLTTDSCIAFSNAELIDRLYATIQHVSDWNDDLSEALFFLADEVIERFAPEERSQSAPGRPSGRTTLTRRFTG